uniref:RNA helicase n=1 Tax=Heterorhabditis bacteriophora TaxID=37862 RepID=A0A1I7WP48_HETBA
MARLYLKRECSNVGCRQINNQIRSLEQRCERHDLLFKCATRDHANMERRIELVSAENAQLKEDKWKANETKLQMDLVIRHQQKTICEQDAKLDEMNKLRVNLLPLIPTSKHGQSPYNQKSMNAGVSRASVTKSCTIPSSRSTQANINHGVYHGGSGTTVLTIDKQQIECVSTHISHPQSSRVTASPNGPISRMVIEVPLLDSLKEINEPKTTICLYYYMESTVVNRKLQWMSGPVCICRSTGSTKFCLHFHKGLSVFTLQICLLLLLYFMQIFLDQKISRCDRVVIFVYMFSDIAKYVSDRAMFQFAPLQIQSFPSTSSISNSVMPELYPRPIESDQEMNTSESEDDDVDIEIAGASAEFSPDFFFEGFEGQKEDREIEDLKKYLRKGISSSLDEKIAEVRKNKNTSKEVEIKSTDDVEQLGGKDARDSIREKNMGKKRIVKVDNFFEEHLSTDVPDTLSFEQMNLSRPILKAIGAAGFSDPTPIQASCIPVALSGKDICACAATGTGKTAAFVLPILERLLYRSNARSCTRVLVLVPTRELAIQVFQVSIDLEDFKHNFFNKFFVNCLHTLKWSVFPGSDPTGEQSTMFLYNRTRIPFMLTGNCKTLIAHAD